MRTILLASLGIVCIGVAVLEPLWTALWIDGHGGPITRRFNSWMRRIVRRVAGDSHHLLSLCGPVVLVSSVMFWAMLLWTGWFTLFSADPRSVLHTQTHTPADAVARIYYTGYSLLTLGNGDFVPNGKIWQLATSVSSLSGLFMLTLSVTYLLAVIEAVVAKRSFAGRVWSMGRNAEAFVLHAWNGRGFPAMEVHLDSITQELSMVTEQHQAYPMLHYYHEAKPDQSVAVNLAILDDALTLFEAGVLREVNVGPAAIHSARDTVRAFLETLEQAYIDADEHEPPLPSLARLRNAGIPVVDDATFASALAGMDRRRRLLGGFLSGERREWPHMDAEDADQLRRA